MPDGKIVGGRARLSQDERVRVFLTNSEPVEGLSLSEALWFDKPTVCRGRLTTNGMAIPHRL